MKKFKMDKKFIAETLVRAVVAGTLTIGTALLLYLTMGPTVWAAVLFAVACSIINILSSYIRF